MHTSFDEFVSGKHVAVIGGSDEIEWDAVEECDVVVRVNGHWLRQRGRCEVLFYSCADDLDYRIFGERALWQSLKWGLINNSHRLFGGYASQKTEWVISQMLEHCIPVETYLSVPARAWEVFAAIKDQRPWSRELAERYDFHPLTGVLAVERMMCSPAASVYVTGMTMYQRPNGEVPFDVGTHYTEPNLQFFRDRRQDERLKLSPRLESVIGQRK